MGDAEPSSDGSRSNISSESEENMPTSPKTPISDIFDQRDDEMECAAVASESPSSPPVTPGNVQAFEDKENNSDAAIESIGAVSEDEGELIDDNLDHINGNGHKEDAMKDAQEISDDDMPEGNPPSPKRKKSDDKSTAEKGKLKSLKSLKFTSMVRKKPALNYDRIESYEKREWKGEEVNDVPERPPNRNEEERRSLPQRSRSPSRRLIHDHTHPGERSRSRSPDEERPRKRRYEEDGASDSRRPPRRERNERGAPANTTANLRMRCDALLNSEMKAAVCDEGELRNLIQRAYELLQEQDHIISQRGMLFGEMLKMKDDEHELITTGIQNQPEHLKKVLMENYDEIKRKFAGHSMGPMPPPGAFPPGAFPPGPPPNFVPGGPMHPMGPPPILNGSSGVPPNANTNVPPPTIVSVSDNSDQSLFNKPPPAFTVPPPGIPETGSPSTAQDFSKPPPLKSELPKTGSMPNLSVPPPNFSAPPPEPISNGTATAPPPTCSSNQAPSAPYMSSVNSLFPPGVPPPTMPFPNMGAPPPVPMPPGGPPGQTGPCGLTGPTPGANIASFLTNMIASSIKQPPCQPGPMGRGPGMSGPPPGMMMRPPMGMGGPPPGMMMGNRMLPPFSRSGGKGGRPFRPVSPQGSGSPSAVKSETPKTPPVAVEEEA